MHDHSRSKDRESIVSFEKLDLVLLEETRVALRPSGKIAEINLITHLRRHGPRAFLEQLVRWEAAPENSLVLRRRALSNPMRQSLQLAPLTSGTSSGSWHVLPPNDRHLKVVAEMLRCGKDTWWHYNGAWTALHARWMEEDHMIQVDSDLLQELVELGVMLSRPTDFGDKEFSVADDTYVWEQRSLLEAGSRSLALYDPELPDKHQNKLGLMLALAAQGWQSVRPSALTGFGYGLEEHFDGRLARPLSYFLALLKKDDICDKLPLRDGLMPAIRHNMPGSYYAALLHSKDLGKLQALC